jgi:ABC-2 type transport system ATP-binding protein
MLKQGRVVALDSTSALLKAASNQVLCFKTDGDLPPALAVLARVTGRVVQFAVPDAAAIEHVLAQVRQAQLAVHDLEIRRADLEDVFLHVMAQHHPRQEAV